MFNEYARVKQLSNKNQFVISFTNNKNETIRVFQSYDSICAIYNTYNNGLTLGYDWDYSKTTLKHLKLFINEYTIYKVDSKKDILNLIEKNIFVVNNCLY